MERAEGKPAEILLVYSLVLHVSGTLGVNSMLKKKIMAVLSEGSSECKGNPIQIQKYKNVDNLPKNCPMAIIFVPELAIEERNFFWMFKYKQTTFSFTLKSLCSPSAGGRLNIIRTLQ